MFFLLCSFLASFPCMSSLPCFLFPWLHSILPYFHNVFFLPTWLFHFFSLILIPSFLYLFLLVSCISSIHVPFRSFLDSLHVGFTDSSLTFFYFPYVFFIPSFFEFYLTLSLGLSLMFLLVPFLLSLTDFFHCFFLSLCPILFKQDGSTLWFLVLALVPVMYPTVQQHNTRTVWAEQQPKCPTSSKLEDSAWKIEHLTRTSGGWTWVRCKRINFMVTLCFFFTSNMSFSGMFQTFLVTNECNPLWVQNLIDDTFPLIN